MLRLQYGAGKSRSRTAGIEYLRKASNKMKPPVTKVKKQSMKQPLLQIHV